MGRKPTGRTTKLIRVPVELEPQVKDYLERLKQGEFVDLDPLPDVAITWFMRSVDPSKAVPTSTWDGLHESLQGWKSKAVNRFGERKAKQLIKEKYGEKFCRKLFTWSPKYQENRQKEKERKEQEAERVNEQRVKYWDYWHEARIATRAQSWCTPLQVQPDATEMEVKEAYYELARRYHPDLNPQDEEAVRKMQEINLAWEKYKSLC
jgi:hypothetical protein